MNVDLFLFSDFKCLGAVYGTRQLILYIQGLKDFVK